MKLNTIKNIKLLSFILVFLTIIAISPMTFADDVNWSNWSEITSSFGTTYINSVATNGTTWVAVGNSGKLATATDPTGTWTQRTSSFGTSNILSVATDGNIWVTVGVGGKLATATDPTGTWTQRTSSFGTSNIYSVAYGNGVWVAVGTGGKLATATDPTGTWTQRTSSFSTNNIWSVAYGNKVWIAVGNNGKLATATDPTGTWTQRTSSFETSAINSVAYGNGVWVTVGDEGKLATATDPTGTWTQRTSSFYNEEFEYSTVIKTIAYGNGVWVAAGDEGKLATATDPTGTWTQRTSPFEYSIQSVATDGTNWIIAGVIGKLAYLSTIIETVTPSFATGTYNNNLSVTLTTNHNGSTGIYYTTDGSTPNNTNTLYTGAITISGTTTLKAVSYNGTNYSEIMIETYTMQIFGTPTANKNAGVYYNPINVALTKAGTTIGTKMTYTIDGSNPTIASTEYTTPIAITGTTTLKFAEFKSGYTAGTIVTKTYTLAISAVDVNWSNWLQLTSSFEGSNIEAVATNGTTWVAVGSSGKLATATDPTRTWTQRTSSFEWSHIYDVATDGTTWVAVGQDGKLATATDPTGTWTQRTSSFGSSYIYGIATDGTTWVAVGTDGKIATATDPTGTWTQRTSNFESSYISGIATDGTTWVAVGDYGKLATATDPTGTWTQRTSNFESSYIRGIAYGNRVWVAVGDNGKLATATDPTGTWTQRTSNFGNIRIGGIATDETTWVAVGQLGKLATATDPTGTWTQRTSSFGTSYISGIATDGTTWVAVGYGGKLATATVGAVTPSETTGTFYNDFNVTLTTNQPNSIGIYYTTDGTDPDNTNTLYTTPITINETTTLKAVSYDGANYTNIMSETYTIRDPYLHIQFYDENSGLKMDDNLYLTISGTDYYADENGLWDYKFSDIGITPSPIINATVNSPGYTERDFSFYTFNPRGHDYNFLMLPSSLGLSIDFRARDLSDNLWTNKFVSFEALSFDASGTTIENSLLGSYKTNNSGEFTAFIDPDADYNAVLYNATGVEETTYQKTNVIVSKPKNEITGSDISPYDISVGNLLSYNVTNSTNATESIMIFGGTISQYLFRVVDYNSIPADRVYIPRTYSVNNPFGSEYSKYSTYNLQPYLLSEDDGIVPTIYVVDNLNRPIANVLIKIYKTFNNDTILTESLSTDGSGRIVFSAYPLDTYIFEAYYEDELVNTLSFVPRTSNDIFFMKIDLTNITNYTNYNVITVDLSNLNSSYTTTDNPIDFNIRLYANDPTKLTSYTANLIQGTTVLDTTTSSVTQTAYTQDYEISFDSTGIEEGSAKVQVIVSYTEDDVAYTKTFYKTIFITSDTVTPETALKNLKTNEGNLLTIFLSLLITVAIVGLISMSGLYINTNALVLLGVLILGFFVAIGWLSTGTTILGTDPLIFLFSIIVIFTLYKLFSSNQEN